LVALAGCSSDDEAASTLPDVTSTLSPSGTPSPTPSPSRAAELEAEITAFFQDYIDTVNESWTSEKALERRREMFEDTCSDCLAGYLFAKRAHDENLILKAGNVTVLRLEVTSAEDDQVTFVTTENSPAGELVDVDGQVVQEFDEYVRVQIVNEAARNSNGDWVLVRSDLL
jgi:hypothetical protein